MTTDITRTVGSTKITVRADFAQAADPIMVRYSDCGEEAEFSGTGKQVADFRHNKQVALKHFVADFKRNN